MTITYRSVKGSALTHNELDANFTHLVDRVDDGWDDLVADITTRGGPSAPVHTVYKGGIYLYEFTPGDTLDVFANFHLNHRYKWDTMLYPHIHFVTTSNATGDVRWGFEYTWARRGDDTGQVTFPATSTIYITNTIASNSADKHFVWETPEGQGIDGTGIRTDAMLLMRVFREGAHVSDTFPDSVWGITVDVHYEVNRGATPYRSPPFLTP